MSEDELCALERRVAALEQRNQRVEAAKRWEISRVRHAAIALLTYGVMVLIFQGLNAERPWADAIVPTAGFILSTVSLQIIERWITRARD